MVEQDVLRQLHPAEGPQVQVQAEVLLHVPVHAEHRHAAVVAFRCRGVDDRNLFIIFAVI